MKISAFFRITRPMNSLVAGIATSLGFLIATGTLYPEFIVLIAIVVLVTAAGNVVNDFFDVEIDAINRPDRPIPSGEIQADSPGSFAALLFVFGIGLSFLTNSLCMGIAVFNSLLLVLYAAYLKKTPLIGNLAVSYLSASIFLFGGAFAGMEGLLMNLPVAAITFLAMTSREVLKDAEDVLGDKMGGATTLPMVIGIRKTSLLALLLLGGAVAISLLPVVRGYGPLYLVSIGCVDLFLLYGAVRAAKCDSSECLKATGATSTLKYGMFAAVFIFVLSAIFLS
ncbi:MAG TPA: geranylgeranylglycerol-phosphate geranylgeranyltransferase [Methanomicrobiales archaeon]|nr:geranylgeranylglycerol-phosphate geranylgeranyltransferase [Methanomicrobiales archaeon]